MPLDNSPNENSIDSGHLTHFKQSILILQTLDTCFYGFFSLLFDFSFVNYRCPFVQRTTHEITQICTSKLSTGGLDGRISFTTLQRGKYLQIMIVFFFAIETVVSIMIPLSLENARIHTFGSDAYG